MIRIQDTKNMIGITIHGDYEDLQTLHHAISDYLRFYFDHQDGPGAYSCYENILGLCYDIRHAYQGDRNIEAVDNNHENVGLYASCLYEFDEKPLQKERNKYKNGNLYFNVEVLYPWAVFYLYALQAISEDVYRHEWFTNDEFGYTEYQAEHDLALIQYFVQLLWGKLRENLPEEVMHVLWDYTRIFNHVEYYFDYSDLYLEWFCTYWVNAVTSRQQRLDMLPLLCLELSSILDEDPDELEETIEAAKKQNKNASGETEDMDEISDSDAEAVEMTGDATDGMVAESEQADETTELERKFFNVQASFAQNTLRGLELFDDYAQTYYKKQIPYQSMDDFLDVIYEYVQENGPFDEESYEKWLDQELGEVDWDRLEW